MSVLRGLWRCVALLTVVFGLAACQSHTRINEVSSDAPEAALLKRVLVVGIDVTPEVQKSMEQAFAHKLAAKGRDVVLVSDWYPAQRPTREQVAERAAAEGISSVLVTRLLNYEQDDDAQKVPAFSFTLALPPRSPDARVGWEQDTWVAGPPARDEAVVTHKVSVETRLYDTATGRVVWEARSRTVMTEADTPDFDGFAAAIVAQLRRNGWMPH